MFFMRFIGFGENEGRIETALQPYLCKKLTWGRGYPLPHRSPGGLAGADLLHHLNKGANQCL